MKKSEDKFECSLDHVMHYFDQNLAVAAKITAKRVVRNSRKPRLFG